MQVRKSCVYSGAEWHGMSICAPYIARERHVGPFTKTNSRYKDFVSIRNFYVTCSWGGPRRPLYRSALHSRLPAESSSRRAGVPPNPPGWLRPHDAMPLA